MAAEREDFLQSITSEESDTYPDTKSKKEYKQFESKNNYNKKTLSALKKKRFQDNTKLRSRLSLWAFLILSVWIISVIVILFFNEAVFCISDNVLITLLSTTTINIIGIVLIVMKDIFNGLSEINMEDID